jgi:outer membrane protein TolC
MRPGFDASWELDLFGGKRRSLEAATASWQASVESMNDVMVSLLAEVALNYVEVRSDQALLSITESNLTTRSETYDITRWRHEAGLTTQLDEEQAKASLELVRAQIPTLRTSLEQAKYRLAVLLGQPPGTLNEVLAEAKAVPSGAGRCGGGSAGGGAAAAPGRAGAQSVSLPLRRPRSA